MDPLLTRIKLQTKPFIDKGYCGVIVFVYKNIIQSSNTACIPELQLAFLSLSTHSTSTAYVRTRSKERDIITNYMNFMTFTMNDSTSECSCPWHFICQAEPNFDDNYETKAGLPDTYLSLTNIHFY